MAGNDSRDAQQFLIQTIKMASKLQISLFAGLLFYVVANPVTYEIVNALFSAVGLRIAVSGKPTGTGLLLHSIVYAAVTYLLMQL